MTEAVAVRGLICQFGPVRAVDDLSFEVAEGEVFGLLGPNGASKTTVIRVVTTLLKPAAGTMQIFGLDTRRSTMRVRRLIGYVPQQLSTPRRLLRHRRAAAAGVCRRHRLPGRPHRPAPVPHEELLVAFGTAAQLPSPIPSAYRFPPGL